MKLLVTGAAGFLGRHVVEEAAQRGHRVHALLRRGGDPGPEAWAAHPEIEVSALDLREPEGLKERLAGVDAVIHLAAVLHGDREAQRRGTIAPTQTLCEAMVASQSPRLILVSSLSVYDYRRIPASSELDEDSPLEARPEEREPYCEAKLGQEEIARRHANHGALSLTVLRPGAVIGAGHLWTDHLGLRLGKRLWLHFSGDGMAVPLTGVENCAEAIVVTAERPEAIGVTFNIVDDALPSRSEYLAALRQRLPQPPRVLTLPGAWLRALAQGLAPVRRALGRLPWFLNDARIDTQLKPLRFSNARITRTLGWRPRYDLAEILDRSVGKG